MRSATGYLHGGPRWIVAITALLVAASLGAQVARAEEAPADTGLVRFLGGLADSTDTYFGISAQPADTTGLDSALVYGLDHPFARDPMRLRPEFTPDFRFNRVDGPVYIGGVAIGRRSRTGRLGGRVGYASGPNDWLGGAEYDKTFREHDAFWTFRAGAGRVTQVQDRDFSEPRLGTLRALINGSDTRHYLRRDGFETSIERETSRWRVSAQFRDALETPIATSATWNLMDEPLRVVENVPAARGRNHELSYQLGVRLPLLPIIAQVDYATSSGSIGSDFEYRRTRYALGGDVSVGRWLAVVPQAQYGVITGDEIPQAAFYLGGSKTLRGIAGESLGGSRTALARLDLIEAPDILSLLRIPHPDILPLQLSAFGAVGAVWGVDPYGGPSRPGDRWPEDSAWLTEAGVALLYRPGIPDPTSFMRVNFTWPIGPQAESMRISLSFTRGLDLVRSLGD